MLALFNHDAICTLLPMSPKLVSLDQEDRNGPASSAGWSVSIANTVGIRALLDRTISESLTWTTASDFQECSIFAIDDQGIYADPCLAVTSGTIESV